MLRYVVWAFASVLLLSCHPAAVAPTRPPAIVPPASIAPVLAPPIRTFDESLLSGKEFLLQVLPPAVPAKALDRDLGELAGDEPAVRSARHFFDALRSQADLSSLCDAQWYSYIKTTAASWLATGWTSVDIWGRPQQEASGFWTVAFRGRSAGHTYRGWIALESVNSHWLVVDLQAQETKEADTAFDPESPDQEISSPSLR